MVACLEGVLGFLKIYKNFQNNCNLKKVIFTRKLVAKSNTDDGVTSFPGQTQHSVPV